MIVVGLKDFGQYMVKENEITEEDIPKVVGDYRENHFYGMPLDFTFRGEGGKYYLSNFKGWYEEEREDTYIIIPITKQQAEGYKGNKEEIDNIIRELDLGVKVMLTVYNGNENKQRYYRYRLTERDREYLMNM